MLRRWLGQSLPADFLCLAAGVRIEQAAETCNVQLTATQHAQPEPAASCLHDCLLFGLVPMSVLHWVRQQPYDFSKASDAV